MKIPQQQMVKSCDTEKTHVDRNYDFFNCRKKLSSLGSDQILYADGWFDEKDQKG